MPPRLFVAPLALVGPWPQRLELPPAAARHAQVLRLSVDAQVELFDGQGSVWSAHLVALDRRSAWVQVTGPVRDDAELPLRVTVALGMPANERMDAVVEKATELGMWRLQPLHCQRSVLRLDGERAQRRQAHWQAVAQSAAAQSRRTWVPQIMPVMALRDWLAMQAPAAIPTDSATTSTPREQRWLLSLEPGARRMRDLCIPRDELLLLSGPEGGFTQEEHQLAAQAGFEPLSLGPRVLRSDTAPLAALAALAALI